MATIDLSRFSPNISQDNRQRQIFSEGEASVYDSISKVSGTLADIAVDVIKKNRQRELADYQSQQNNDITTAVAKFDDEWKTSSSLGQIRDGNGRTYNEAKDIFLKDKISEIQSNTEDQSLFNATVGNLEAYRTKQNIDAIDQNFQLSTQAIGFNSAKKQEDWGKNIASLDQTKLNEWYVNTYEPERDKLYKDWQLINKKAADKFLEDSNKNMSELFKQRSETFDFKQNTPDQILKDNVPLRVQYDPAIGGETIKLLRNTTIDPIEKKMLEESLLNNSEAMLDYANENIQLKKQARASTLTPDQQANLSVKIANLKQNIVSKKLFNSMKKRVDNTLGRTSQYEEALNAAAKKTGFPKDWQLAQITVESEGDASAISPTGATGISQFTKKTADAYGGDRTDPISSIDMHSRLMKDNIAMFKGDLTKAFAAYIAGPAVVKIAIKMGGDKWLDFTGKAQLENGVQAENVQDVKDYVTKINMAHDIITSKTPKEVADSTEAELGIGAFTPEEIIEMSPPSKKKAYGLYTNLSPKDMIEFNSKIISYKLKADNSELKNVLGKISNYKYIATDLGNENTTIQGLDRSTAGARLIAETYRNNKKILSGHEVAIAESLLEASMRAAVYKQWLNPSIAKQKGFDMVDTYNTALATVQQEAPELVGLLMAPGAGAQFRSQYVKDMEKQWRDNESLANQNPIKWNILKASPQLNALSREVIKDGKFNEAAWNRYSLATQGEIGDSLLPENRAKLGQQMLAPVVENFKTQLENARITGSENYISVYSNLLGNVSPDLRATIIEQGLSASSAKDRAIWETSALMSTIGNRVNPSLLNDVIKANTPEEIASVQERKADKDYKKTFAKAEEQLATRVHNFYGQNIMRNSVNSESVTSTVKTLKNYVAMEINRNLTADPKAVADRIYDTFFKDKVSLNTSSMFGGSNSVKGTFILKEGENKSKLEASANSEFYKFNSDIKSGKIKLDLSAIPTTGIEEKAKLNFKTSSALQEFLNLGYTMQLQTIDDMGNSRDVYAVLLDQKTGAKYYLRDENKNLIKRRIP